MARAFAAMTMIPHAQLRAFARVAARLLHDNSARAGGARPLRARAGAGLEFLDHRNYQPGDELRRIDWRQSARQQRTIVRRYQLESSTDWYLCVDASSSMCSNDANKWQLAVHCANAMGYVLLEMGFRVGMLLFADQVVGACPAGRGVSHYLRLNQLTQRGVPLATGAGSQLGSCLGRIGAGATAFVISDFLAADQLRRDLAALRTACASVHALHLSAVADSNLNTRGHVTLVDRENGEQLDVVATAEVAARAARHLQQGRSTLQGFCRAQALQFSAWDSACHWRSVLLGHLSAAQRH